MFDIEISHQVLSFISDATFLPQYNRYIQFDK